MNTVTVPKRELKALIKESVREILEQESIKFRSLLVPDVSKAEQKDIEKRYGKPSRKAVKAMDIDL